MSAIQPDLKIKYLVIIYLVVIEGFIIKNNA